MAILYGVKPGAGADHLSCVEDLTSLEHFAHFCRHTAQNFVRNRCLVRASALSFSSLLALIPMLAVAISVTSSLLKSEGENQIYELIDQFVSTLVPPATMAAHPVGTGVTNVNAEVTMPGLVDATTISNALAGGLTETNVLAANLVSGDDGSRVTAQKEVARKIHAFVQNTQSTALGLMGMLLLLYVAISMLANIEATFNDIWGVTRGRNWFRRIGLYWITLTLGPLVLAAALSLLGSAHMTAARKFISEMPMVGEAVFKLLPMLLICLAFSLIYMVVPNLRVRWSAALLGGAVAGLLWHLVNLFGYLFVSRVITNNLIYGSLGLVPVLMAGLYISWVILLFGAQVSCAFQNRLCYLQDEFAENVNQRGREFIALRLMTCLGLRYQNAEPPATVAQMACELSVSPRLAQQIVQTLLVPRLITEVAGSEAAYCPARPLEAINVHQILQAVRSVNQAEVLTRPEPMRDEIYGEFARIEEAERVAAAGITMQALVNRAQASLAAPAMVLALPVAATASPVPEPVQAEAVTIDLPAIKKESPAMVEKVPEEASKPIPEKPARKVVVPEENRDFPL